MRSFWMPNCILSVKGKIYKGANICVYFSWQTKGFNNKEVAIRKYGHYTVQSWTVLTTKNKIKITIRSQM